MSSATSSRPGTALPAFLVGVPLAAGVLCLIWYGPFRDTPAPRYVSHHVEQVEVLLFCCALSALGAKLWRSRAERAAFRAQRLPAWDGRAVPVTDAAPLREQWEALPPRLRRTMLAQRVAAVLDFLVSRRSANELDDQLRALADADSIALEGSYSLTRFITWAIPILGFLGTVLGITQAISGVTPEVLEKSLSTVTDGLALAFDTTALGLALTMLTMFASFIVERTEQGVLEAVDGYVDRHLAHRFERVAAEGSDLLAFFRRQTEQLVHATEELVRRQAEIWAHTLEEAARARAGVESQAAQRLTAGLEAAMARTLEAHAGRLDELEGHVADKSAKVADQVRELTAEIRNASAAQRDGLAQVAQALAALQADEGQLLRLQQTLHQNLEAVAGAGAFEQAVHSLTAAIHLLTARADGPAHRTERRSDKAA